MLQEAIDRDQTVSWGMLVRESASSAARADRLRSLSALLPNLSAGFSEYETQISLAVYGLRFPGIPAVSAVLHSDARLRQRAGLRSDRLRHPASAENARAAQLSIDDGRDLVVQSVASGYITILADSSRIRCNCTRS